MSTIKYFLVISAVSSMNFWCSTANLNNFHKCRIIKKTLNQCYSSETSIYFMQSTKYKGDVVTFSVNNSDYMTVQCHSSIGVDTNKLPNVSFDSVKTIEFVQCSLANDSVLPKIVSNFNMINVRHLKIYATRHREVIELRKDHFKGLEELTSLELFTDDLITFNGNVFEPLYKIKTMKLFVHDVITLPHNIFKSLEVLHTLVISNSGRMKNETKTLNITLKSCINLKYFHLSRVRWPIHINSLLTYNRPLETVEIINNRIETLSENLFKGSSEILSIAMVNNSIKELPKKIFATQSDLERIDLSVNGISSLDNDIFKHNKNLESINLSHNKLNNIEKILFQSLEYLSYLNFAHNNILHIHFELSFGALKSLQTILLSNNEINEVEGRLQCTNLALLDLSHNSVSRVLIEQFFDISTQALTVNLEDNHLESIDFRNISGSEENEKEVSKLFFFLGQKITCNCHTLRISDFFHRRLNLDFKTYAAIKITPENVMCMPTESGASTKVKELKADTLICPLNYPDQNTCPHFCRCVHQPHDNTLSIACSNISVIPLLPNFAEISDIKFYKIQLRIQGNDISELSSVSTDKMYNDVVEIHASHNNIRSLTVDNLPMLLKFLDLRVNRLKFVNADVIARFAALNVLLISENPWNCSLTVPLVAFVKKHREIVADFNSITCSNTLYFLEIEPGPWYDPILVILIFLLLGIVSVAISVYSYRKNAEVISEWIFKKDKFHLMERMNERMKHFDGTIVATEYDKTFGKYVTSKLISKPNYFRIGMIIKDWTEDEAIPDHVLKTLRNSRRVIIILSDYFAENNWRRWNFYQTNSRVIFVLKGKSVNNCMEISNKILVNFGDPWFWDKLKYAMRNCEELLLTDDDDDGDDDNDDEINDIDDDAADADDVNEVKVVDNVDIVNEVELQSLESTVTAQKCAI